MSSVDDASNRGQPRSIRELSSLAGRVAAVTGGAGHLGSTMLEALAELGATVVIVDVRQDAAQATSERLRHQYGVETMAVVADLEQSGELATIAPAIVKRFGRLDILINNAALVGTSELRGWAVPFEEQSADTWRRAIDVNLTAAFVLTQSAAAHLSASGSGVVVNIGSIYGVVGPDWRLYEGTTLGNPAAYAASKGGLLQLTRWLATTLAPRIRVNMLSPGGIYRHTPTVFLERYVARTPMRRMATEEDFKGAIAYLASDLSSYMTGHNLIVDGGWTAW